MLIVRCVARGHFVQERSQTVDVHPSIATLASDLFWCHVVGCSELPEEAGKRQAPRGGSHGHADVHDSRRSIAAQHHVGGLETAMDDIVAVHVLQGVADQQRDAKSLLGRQRPDTLKAIAKGRPQCSVTRQGRLRVIDREDLQNAWMVQLLRHLDFTIEP